MNDSPPVRTSRRDFLKGTTTTIAATSALSGVVLPHVHADDLDTTVQIALVGCGGRGTGAAANALSIGNGPTKLVAMADAFEDRLNGSFKGLKGQYGDKVDVSEDKKFIGYDGYKAAIDSLKPGGVAIFATPPAFRWVHFQYAIERGVNVFMEKPVAVDGPSARRMLDLATKASAKGLKVGVGLMCRHCRIRQELYNRIQEGEIGEIMAMRTYRMHGPVASGFSTPRPPEMNELEWQIRRFHSFLWASGGAFSDYYIHNIDEACWMKNAWPVEAQASGGRHFRGNNVDQNFDNYSVEYTFADGVKLFHYGRIMPGVHDQFASYAHGTKGLAVISSAGHYPSNARIYNGQKITNSKLYWKAPKEGPDLDPYRLEWEDLVDAIRKNKPYNEVERGTKASLVACMGRRAAHTGQIVTWDDMLNSTQEFAPNVDKLTRNSPAPVLAKADGTYPVPMPGITKDTEY